MAGFCCLMCEVRSRSRESASQRHPNECADCGGLSQGMLAIAIFHVSSESALFLRLSHAAIMDLSHPLTG